MATTKLNAAGQSIDKFSGTVSTGPIATQNQAIGQAMGGAVTSSGQIVSAGGQVQGTANPKDMPGYVAGSSPTDKLDTSTAVDTSRPSPTTVNQATDVSNPQTPATTPLKPTDQAPKDLVNQVNQAQSQVDALKQKYTGIYNTANQTGVVSPTSQGAANNAINQIDKAITPSSTPETPAPVKEFMNPGTNPNVDQSIQTLREILSPQADRQALNDQISQLAADRKELSGLKTELMNVKRVMAGTEQDIRDEITKAGGFATNSQVMGLTVARNKGLLQQGQLISDQIQSQTDLVNTDVSLVGDMKQMAQQQFANNMSILNYQQTNYNNQMNAFRDGIKTLASDNPQGLLAAMQADPIYAQRVQSANPAYTSQALQGLVSTKQVDNQIKQATLAHTLAETAKLNRDSSGSIGNGLSLKDYVTISTKGNQYVDLSTVSDKAEKKAVETQARASGIPVVTDANAGKMNAIEDTRNNLDNIQAQFDKIGYSNGFTKATGGLGFGLSNRVADFFGSTNVGSFKAWRTAAINSVQALAGGTGSGLRINQAEIDAATKNDIPNISDTVAVGKAKMDVLRAQLDGWEKILTGSNNRQTQGGTNPLGI